MNEAGQAPERELIFRRLADPFPLGHSEYAPFLWLVAVGVVLALGIAFVVWMYRRDSRACRWYWAVPLAGLRASVYALVAGAFLLPAVQQWETTEKRSRVLIILDVSPSIVQTTDELSVTPATAPKTRIDKVVDLLTNEQLGFMSRLLEKNPVYVYRFGTRLDDEAQVFEKRSPAWAKADWDPWVRYDLRPWVRTALVRGLSDAGRAAVEAAADAKGRAPDTMDAVPGWVKEVEAAALPTLDDEDKKLLTESRERVEKRLDVARSIVLGTNVPDSLLSVLNRETANLVQAVVVFSDGRSNLGSDAVYRTLRDRAGKDGIPIFTVAVGEPRENIGIAITDVQLPDHAPPDEQFKVVVEADGIGLGDTNVEVKLGLYLPGRDPKKDAPDHELRQSLTFLGNTSPPHGTAEFVVDPEKLPEELTEPSKKVGVRRQLKQGAWAAVARIARDKREVFADAEHVSPARVVQVLDRPLRVLLFAGGATREYQTLRTLLVREVQQNRAELSVCLQSEAAREGHAVQDVPPERMLTKFPTRLDLEAAATAKPEDKYYNLNEYDLIVAFDPDWSELSADQVKNLQSWVDNLGGGLILVAGPIHTFQLARADEDGRLRPLLDVLPVLPDDVILVKTRGVPRTPRRLLLKPSPEYDVLRLEDDANPSPTAGWEQFFTGQDKYVADSDPRVNTSPARGFFAYYPVKGNMPKPGATTLAEFLDVGDNGEPVPRPWLVTTQPARGRSVFLASGEVWRLRAVSPDYYDRFWVKLARFAGANRDARASRGRVLLSKEFTVGSQIRVQARLLAPNGQPYPESALNPKFVISQYGPDGTTKVKDHGPFELRPRKGGGAFDGYYAGQVLAEAGRFPPGDSRYRVVVEVPDSAGDSITGEFIVKKSDPELDNTRPDFAALEQAASTLEEVRARVKDPAILEKLRGGERDPAKVRLAYKLADTDKLTAIPDCVDEVTQTFRNRGAVEDLWDQPLTISLNGSEIRLVEFDIPGLAPLGRTWLAPQTVRIPFLLLVGVSLLGLEWLVRKLLRLA